MVNAPYHNKGNYKRSLGDDNTLSTEGSDTKAIAELKSVMGILYLSKLLSILSSFSAFSYDGSNIVLLTVTTY
jgi:hypothetical protein